MKQVILFCLLTVFFCALIIPASAHVSYAAGVPYSEYPAPMETDYPGGINPYAAKTTTVDVKTFIIIGSVVAAIIFIAYLVAQHKRLSSLADHYVNLQVNTNKEIESLKKDIEYLKNK